MMTKQSSAPPERVPVASSFCGQLCGSDEVAHQLMSQADREAAMSVPAWLQPGDYLLKSGAMPALDFPRGTGPVKLLETALCMSPIPMSGKQSRGMVVLHGQIVKHISRASSCQGRKLPLKLPLLMAKKDVGWGNLPVASQPQAFAMD
jgi:hypothetical protein